jgi:hypothetical protein
MRIPDNIEVKGDEPGEKRRVRVSIPLDEYLKATPEELTELRDRLTGYLDQPTRLVIQLT